MNKGNMGLAAALLITAIVGIVIVDSVASPIYTSTSVVNESLGTVYNGTTDTLANNCVVSAPTSVYDWTNGTEIATTNFTMSPGSYPNRASNTITWTATNFLHNGTVVGINYTYGCTYGSSSTVRLIMEYLPVVAGALVLVLAGGWVFMRM